MISNIRVSKNNEIIKNAIGINAINRNGESILSILVYKEFFSKKYLNKKNIEIDKLGDCYFITYYSKKDNIEITTIFEKAEYKKIINKGGKK